MATAKRLYLYAVSGVSLGLLLYAAWILTGLLLDRLGSGSAPLSVVSTDGSNRESLALAIGFVVVGLPLWLFHWAVVERMVTGDGHAAPAERQSIVRGVYFGVVLLGLSYLIATSGVDALREAITRPLGATDPYSITSVTGSLSWLIVGLAAFSYHGWIRARDLRLGPAIECAAAWVSRLFFYGVAWGAMTTTLIGVATMITTVGEALSGYAVGPDSYSPYGYGFGYLVLAPTAAWWVRPFVGAAATALVFGGMWLAYWWYAGRLTARADRQGLAERLSRVRLTYFVVVVSVAVAYALTGFAESLGVALRSVVGSWHSTAGQSLWGEILVPSAATVPLIAGWWWHRRAAVHEWVAESGGALPAVRPIDYMTALVGLAVFGGALVSFLALLLEKFTGSDLGIATSVDDWRTSAAGAIGFLGVAVPFWLVAWFSGQGRLTADRLGEVRSTARRAYLYAVGGVTVVAGALSLALIVYRATRIAVGLDPSTFGSDVRVPFCILVVTLPLAAYHAHSIRADQASQPAGEVGVAGAGAVEPEPASRAVSIPIPRPELVIVGPTGADYEPLRASVAAMLPDGFSIAVRLGEGPTRT
jgi:hypothetical protein